MDITNDILTRLQNGEKVEDIAAELTKSINEANEKYEAKKKEEDQHLEKIAAVDDLLGCIEDVLILWGFGDDQLMNEIEALKAEEVVETLDTIVPFVVKYSHFSNDLQEAFSEKPAADRIQEGMSDALDDFLNTFVRS